MLLYVTIEINDDDGIKWAFFLQLLLALHV